LQLQIAIKCSQGELCPRREGLRGHEALGTLCGTLYTSTIIPNPFRYTSSSARPSLTTPTGTSPLVLLLALSCPRADPSSKSPNQSGLQVTTCSLVTSSMLLVHFNGYYCTGAAAAAAEPSTSSPLTDSCKHRPGDHPRWTLVSGWQNIMSEITVLPVRFTRQGGERFFW
jgi:hypothetical protein